MAQLVDEIKLGSLLSFAKTLEPWWIWAHLVRFLESLDFLTLLQLVPLEFMDYSVFRYKK